MKETLHSYYMNHDVTFIDIDGIKIAYYSYGQGEPMLLVHGITTYSFIWRNMIPSLSEKYNVIAVDLLGCGESDKPAGVDYSIAAQSEILRKLMERLNLEAVHLVCHDIGGGIGQIMAVKYPEHIKDLVLINSVAYDYWPVQPIVTMRIPLIRQVAMASMDLGIFNALIRRGIYHKERVTDELLALFWKPLHKREGRQGFLQLAKCLNNNDLMDIADNLRNLKMPVLIIRGDADPYLGSIIAERLHSEIKGSYLEIVKTGGHFVQEDEPDLLVALIGKFISRDL
jgi:pimeloyl-ACP methyl ester carboxylesterase